MNHLFVTATTGQRILFESDRIHHTITAYSRIKQPEEWSLWISLQIYRFEEGLVVNSQYFINSAAINYIKISDSGLGFGGNSTTISEYIVSIMASVSEKRSAPITKKPVVAARSSTKISKPLPPFVRHFKDTSTSDAAIFKVGDSK